MTTNILHNDWLKTRKEVEDEISNNQPFFCVCGRLATGLHESSCKKLQNKITRETLKRLKHKEISNDN